MRKSTVVSTPALAVMARYPQPGRVKTRLARALGSQPACDLYRAFLLDIEHRFGGNPRRPLLWVFEPADSDFGGIVNAEGRLVPQRGADLGARMYNCFQRLTPDYSSVVMIGADVPHLPGAWIEDAERRLRSADVVLGPSSDGGYYLIAMKQAHDVFAGVEMGSPRVLEQTLARVAALGLVVTRLPAWFDIDESEDVERLRSLLLDGQVDLPATRAVLAMSALGPR